MNKRLVCTRGIPASGKSTWAKSEKGAKIFSKDKLRKLKGITKENWTKDIEEIIVKEERELVLASIKDGDEYIIIDNTHLGKDNRHIKFYRELAKKKGYKFIIKEFFVTRADAIERDKNREDSVGVRVIDDMIKIHGNGGYPLNPVFRVMNKKANAYIFDMDGTLAFMDGQRNPFDYKRVNLDKCNIFLRSIMYKLIEDNTVFIVSGRDGLCKEETIQWLIDNDVPYDFLYMRETGDKRKDSVIKKEIYRQYIEKDYDVWGVFDDRNQVVDMWRLELNLPTYQCWYGNF